MKHEKHANTQDRNRALKLLAADLGELETTRYPCIACHGGSSKEASMAVTREAGWLLYICYRATCGLRGRVRVGVASRAGTLADNCGGLVKGEMKRGQLYANGNCNTNGNWNTNGNINANLNENRSANGMISNSILKCERESLRSYQRVNRNFKNKPYNYPLQRINSQQFKFFNDKFSLNRQHVYDNDIKYNPALDSFAFPIYDRYGQEIGILDRSYSGRQPKAIQYWHNNNDNNTDLSFSLHFPRGLIEPGPELCIVEDHISAIRLADYKQSAAIMGSFISANNAIALSKLYDTIILMLDNDATDKAIQQKLRYQNLFTQFEVRFLKKDIKNMTNNELEEYLAL